MGFPIPDRVGSWSIGFARVCAGAWRGAPSCSENWYLKHKKREDRTEVLSPVVLLAVIVVAVVVRDTSDRDLFYLGFGF